MYLKRFHLSKHPFHITPDPEFLYLSPSHKEALASIIYGVEEKKGFIAIVGEVGVGKTTILRSYLERVDKEKLRVIFLFNPNMSFKNLIKTLCMELGVSTEKEDYFELVPRLHNALIEEYRKGINVVLIIDEAQNMPIETLENLRMLSNLETTKDKLIQILLCGQIELDYMLNQHQLRQLAQRIFVRSIILPLTTEESVDYVRHRLARAGCRRRIPFTKMALKKIVRHSRGIPRIINILCDNALIAAYGCNEERVTTKNAKEVIIDRTRKRSSEFPKWAAASLFLLLLAGFGLWFFSSKVTGSISIGKYFAF